MGGGISFIVSGEAGLNGGASSGEGEELIMPGAPPINAGAKRPPGGGGLSSEPKGSNASIFQKFSNAQKQASQKRKPYKFWFSSLLKTKVLMFFVETSNRHTFLKKSKKAKNSTFKCCTLDKLELPT